MDAVSNPVAKRMKPNPQGDANERAQEQGERPLSLTSNQGPQEPSSTTLVTVDDMAEQQDDVTAVAAFVAAASSPLPSSSSRDAEGSNQVETLPQYHTTPHYNHDHLNDHDYTPLESKVGVRYSPPVTDHMTFPTVPGVETVAHIDAGEEATAMAAAAAAVPIPGGIEMLQDGTNSYFKAGVRQDGMIAHPGVFHHSFYPQPDEHYQDHQKQQQQQHTVQGENENGEEGQQELHRHPSQPQEQHQHQQQQQQQQQQQHQQEQQQQQEQVDGKESSSHPIMPPLVSGSNISVPMPSMTTILPSSEVLSSSGPSTLVQRPPSHDPSNMYFEGGPRPAHTLSSTDPAYRRKDKSLGVLCANFMRRYSKMTTERPGESTEVTIDEASQSLMVERRRIYDIINILEAIEVVTRKGKNTYNWHGLSNITHTLRKLQQEALELFPDDVVQNQLDKLPKGHSTEPTGFDLLLASAEQVEKPLKRGKEKSLGRLSQKFIMLFLVGNETITLEEASDKILGKTDLPQAPPDATAEEMLKIRNANNKMIKTKIRRLYDIANIMASVGLIAKLHTENQAVGNAPRAKPMFKWIYPLTASEIMAQVDPTGDQQQQQQQQQQQPAEDALLAHHGAGDVQGAAKTGENDVVENPVALHQQHDQFSYPHQYPNDHHNHYHRNDQQEEQQHKQPYLRQTNTDSNVTYAETNHLAEEGITNAMERNAALIANSVANNGDDCIHDMEAAAAAEAAVAAFEEGGNITGQNDNYAGGDQERHEQVAMEESESIAV